MRRVVYVGFYDEENPVTRKRNALPSSITKMQYIIQSFQTAGYSVDVVSPARPEDGKPDKGYLLHKDGYTLKLFSSTWSNNVLGKAASYFQRRTSLFFYLLKHLRADDIVVVYHSVFYASILTRLKKIIGFQLIAEVEEIYGDVTGKRSIATENAFFEVADAYIFPTELLNSKINTSGKPHAIIHGTYQCEPERGVKFDDDKIHVVYAGILDPRKGGMVAAAAAEYLDERYSIHILGFGLDEEVASAKQFIENVSKKAKCTVRFEGLKRGEAYIQFLQSCHIGLCPQDPAAAFTSTSFPSKILSYLSNGLRVLSIRIPAIAHSAVGKHLFFFDEQTPEGIANALQSIDLTKPYDSRSLIRSLDHHFVSDMQRILDGFSRR